MEPLECGPGGTDPNDPCPPPSEDPTTTPSGPTVTPSPGNPGGNPSATASHDTGDDDTNDVAPGEPTTTVPTGPMLPVTGFDSTAMLITGALVLAAGIVAVVVARLRTRRS